MDIPILKQGDILLVSIQGAPTDTDLQSVAHQLSRRVGDHRSKGVIIDVTALDVMDSFAARMLRDTAYTLRLRGAETVICGIQPDAAFTMVRLGMTLEGVETVLDLEEGLELFRKRRRGSEPRG